VTNTITYVPTAVTSTILTTSCFTGQVTSTSAVATSTYNAGFPVRLTSYTTFPTFGTSCTSYVTTTVSTLPPPTMTV
jgi:hypothetical protein